jgi:Tol biopolymer transport system component
MFVFKRVRMARFATAAASCLLLVGMGAEKHSERIGGTEWIAFLSKAPTGVELFVMRPDGSGRRQLTNDGVRIGPPRWSPAGQITFESSRDRARDTVQVIPPNNPQGLPPRTATPFASDLQSIYADGSGRVNLTRAHGINTLGAWSPDGKQIAFTSTRDEGFDIYVMSVGAGSATRLTLDGAFNYVGSWSRDGKQIVYSGSPLDPNAKALSSPSIFVMSATGLNVKPLTAPNTGDVGPVWSPTADEIAFSTARDGSPNIYLMTSTGGNPVRLTNNGSWNQDPAWSPDGTQVVFTSGASGRAQIYTMNRDGSGVRRISNGSADDFAPSWGRAP